MGKVFAIVNEKGGVGKTTICYNLAKGLAAKGYKVLIIDNDPQANLTMSVVESDERLQLTTYELYKEIKVDGEFKTPISDGENLEFIGSTDELAYVTDLPAYEVYPQLNAYLIDTKDKYDFIFIDCGPLFSGLNIAALIAADFVLSPVKPAPYSLKGLLKIDKKIATLNKKGVLNDVQFWGIILNLVEKTNLHNEFRLMVIEEFGEVVFTHSLSKGVKLEESPYFNESIFEYANGTKQSIQFNAIINEFLNRLKKQGVING